MKKPVVDYRRLRLNNLTSPEYSHLLLLLGWVIYFIFYFITENFIPPESCHVMHSPIDDWIPFHEFFLIFYCSWYVWIVLSLLYFVLYDIKSFCSLQKFIIVTQVLAMIIYIVYPSRQDMRPVTFERNNILTALMSFIYRFDTPTGVCPSLHVAYSIGIASTWCKRKETPLLQKLFMVALCLIISISTMFVKQHSFVDVVAALPIGLAAEWFVFRDFWRSRRKLRRATS